MNDSGRPILAIEKLRKQFKRTTALRGIDITIEKPGVYGFLGPNGAGKTTTFKLISGLLRPTAGRVLVCGADVNGNSRRALSNLGVQFDGPVFYPYLTGRDNLRVISRWLGRDLEAKIDELLDTVGLTDAADRRVGGYSWGMKQRLGLASALLPDPKLLLLDEPTSGLDPGGIADVRALLPRLAHDGGRSVMLSSHRMDEVEQVCDHVTIIHRGTIAASGRPRDLAADDNLVDIRCDRAATAAEFLTEFDGVVQAKPIADDRLEVLAPSIRPGEINQYLVERGITADQIVVRSESLEAVFFRLTGGGDSE